MGGNKKDATRGWGQGERRLREESRDSPMMLRVVCGERDRRQLTPGEGFVDIALLYMFLYVLYSIL